MRWGSAGGREVHLLQLGSDCVEVDVCSYGAALVAVRVKVRGEWVDVLLGYESLERYVEGGKPNFGTVVGRCANRIAGASFELDGQTYELDRNNGLHHLHGGSAGFFQQAFEVLQEGSATAVTLALSDPDGAMGYPGKVDVRVTYEVVGNELRMSYEGIADRPTLLSMTNHGYWNLKGHAAGNVLDHLLMVNGSNTTVTDSSLAITGEVRPVKGSGLDLRGAPRLLQQAVDEAGPIDVNYCLDERPSDSAEDVLAARLVGPNGLSMEVWTDQPGIQVFTGHNIADPAHPSTWWHGKGATWERFGAVCLETQLWPDGAHHGSFPSPVLRPGETYRHHVRHVFAVEEAS